MDLLGWMQQKAAKLLGNKVGGEQCVAAREGHRVGAALILGDRSYGVTIQRMMDRLNTWEKMKISALLVWEVLTCNVLKVQDYLRRSEDEPHFVRDEMEELARSLPRVAEVLIAERDEYIAQTILEVARAGFVTTPSAFAPFLYELTSLGGDDGSAHAQQTRRPVLPHKRRIVAVLGAAHIPGVTRWLQQGGVSAARVSNISASSQHACTWPGEGMLQVVNATTLYGPVKEIGDTCREPL
jgi:pheromone shutdown protein TraB